MGDTMNKETAVKPSSPVFIAFMINFVNSFNNRSRVYMSRVSEFFEIFSESLETIKTFFWEHLVDTQYPLLRPKTFTALMLSRTDHSYVHSQPL
jgi:hypothetical protein